MIIAFCCLACDFQDSESDEERMYNARIELADVKIAVVSMQGETWPLIMNFQKDNRITGFVDKTSTPTNNMTNDGLIRIKEKYLSNVYYEDYVDVDMADSCDYYSIKSGSICPPCVFLKKDKTRFYYTVDADGTVQGFLDSKGEDPIVPLFNLDR